MQTPLLLLREVQEYIRLHLAEDTRLLALCRSPFPGLSMSSVAEQIAGYQKARQKLPAWCGTVGILFPKPLALEQCSSEATARFKASCMQGSSFADLTSGFGVDAYFMSDRFDTGISAEIDQDLIELQRHNHYLLGCRNLTYVHQSAAEFLKNSEREFDWIYIDPSRRTESKRRFRFEDCKPDVVSLLPALFRLAPNVLIKASPLLDITAGIAALRGVRKVIAVEQGGECRELLFLLDRSYSGEVEIEASVLDTGYSLGFAKSEEAIAPIVYSDPSDFLYLPSAALQKAGAFRLLADRFALGKLAPNTHVYTSADKVNGFPGRTFRVLAKVKPDPSAVRQYFPGGRALAVSRNHPLAADQLLKKCKLKPGGTRYLIALRGCRKNFLMVAEHLLT